MYVKHRPNHNTKPPHSTVTTSIYKGDRGTQCKMCYLQVDITHVLFPITKLAKCKY